uniref:Uncharacterized protein n=1 Tax=Aegilops tauschii subsp. strangulata TaxID=200361 RepID=A0A453NMG2_AEGTS
MRDVEGLVEPVVAVRDGLGLSDREMAAESAGSGVGNKQHFGRTESEHTISQGSDVFPASSSKRQAGRPTTSPDKAPYEQPSKRSRFYSICRVQHAQEHNMPSHSSLLKMWVNWAQEEHMQQPT